MYVRARVTLQMSARHQGVVHSRVVDQGKAKEVLGRVPRAKAKDGEKVLEVKAKERDSANMGEEKEKGFMEWRVHPIHGEEAVRHGVEERDRDHLGVKGLRNGLRHLSRRLLGILGQVRDGMTMGTADMMRMDTVVMVGMICL